MSRYVHRPDHPEADEFGMVPSEIAGSAETPQSLYVISDTMEPTRHMADGKYYTSKAEFRRATRAAGCVEVGNETNALLKPRTTPKLDRDRRMRDIKQAIDQLRGR